MRVLVTGGAGFIGSHLVEALAGRGDAVVAYDNLAQGRAENLEGLQGRVALVDASMVDLAAAEKAVTENRIEGIVHAAAIASRAVTDPGVMIQVNIQGTANILEVARRCNVRRTIIVSSDEVYGGFQYEPADEDHPRAPNNPYGISKVAGEQFADYYATFYRVDSVVVRPGRVYGPRFPRERVPTTMIRNALQGRPTILPNGGDDKSDYTYVKDLVQGILLALDKARPGYRVYNISGGTAYTTTQIAAIIRDMFPGVRLEVGPGPVEAEGIQLPTKGAMDISKACQDLGYRPAYDIRRGLEEYTQHLRRNPL